MTAIAKAEAWFRLSGWNWGRSLGLVGRKPGEAGY